MGLIVVAYSDKPEGHAVLGPAADEARLRGSAVLVLSTASEQVDDGRLEEFRSGLAGADLAVEIRALQPGVEPADEILDAADAAGAEMIVIGVRRRSAVGKLMLGTNAQRILLDASCPVLTVKSDISSKSDSPGRSDPSNHEG